MTPLTSALSTDRAELLNIPARAEQATLSSDLAELERLQARAVEIGTRHEHDRDMHRLACRAVRACARRAAVLLAQARYGRSFLAQAVNL